MNCHAVELWDDRVGQTREGTMEGILSRYIIISLGDRLCNGRYEFALGLKPTPVVGS